MPVASKIRFCIFDLDGTLVDSLRDIANALNECLELLGCETHPPERYRYMVGEGVPTLCQRAIGESHPYYLQRLIELARPRYRVNYMEHTRPYDGVRELVARLRGAGIQLGVLSNKPHELTRKIVREFWPDSVFRIVQGYVREDLRKPSPHHVTEMCGQVGIPAAETCLVGDTPTDVLTARNAGCGMIAVTWGFRTRADLESAGAPLILDRPAEVAAALGLA
ncbi:MAG: HAD family hydrolase [Planctomycetes bacterium]|nr:HAD family hydrolase [Planctomycetota bacterium]